MRIIFRFLITVSLFSLLALPTLQAVAATQCPCPPDYCIDKNKAKQAKEAKKAAMRGEFPARLLKMIDELPDCIACIRTAPDAFSIRITQNDGSSRTMGWTRHSEFVARKQLKQGTIKSFSIIYVKGDCECCPEQEHDGSLPGGKKKGGISETFDDPKALGDEPPDLTQVTGKPGTQSVPPPKVGPRPKPPRIAQALCPACRDLAAQFNAAEQAVYEMQLKIYNTKKNIDILYHALQLDLERIEQARQLAYTEETAAQVAKAESIYRARLNDYNQALRELEQYEKALKDLEAKRDALAKALLACEKTQCNYREPVNAEPNVQPKKESKKEPKESEPKEESVAGGDALISPAPDSTYIVGLAVNYDSETGQSSISDGFAAVMSKPHRSAFGYGVSSTINIAATPVFVFGDFSIIGHSNRVFDQKILIDANENSTIDVKQAWQGMLGLGFNVLNTRYLNVGVGLGGAITQQKLTANVVEDQANVSSNSEVLAGAAMLIQAGVPVCQHCIFGHPLIVQGRVFAIDQPAQSFGVETNNLNAYDVQVSSNWQWRSEISLGVGFG